MDKYLIWVILIASFVILVCVMLFLVGYFKLKKVREDEMKKEIRYYDSKKHRKPDFYFAQDEEAVGTDEAICVYCGAFIENVEDQLNYNTTNVFIKCNACGKEQEVFRSTQYTTTPFNGEENK